MFFFLPIGLDEASVNRIPWVTIGLAAACVLAFFGTWVLPQNRGADPQFQELVEYWLEHPQVEAPDSLRSITSDGLKRKVAEARRDHPSAATEDEQTAFNQLVDNVTRALNAQPIRRWALVPARGAAQAGWLTYMFLHLGWLHILGNFLFLYLVAPFLEDAWGRPVFLGFYLAGGLLAGLAQCAVEPHAQVTIAGASGAVAACMGAFMVRFASRKVRMFYFIWLVVRPVMGTFLMRAWLWLLIWVGSELVGLALSGSRGGGVATLAHVGGFAFGAVFALALKGSGIERKHLAPAVEATHEGWIQHPGVERAQGALASGDRQAARRGFQEALTAQPRNDDALLGLAKLELEEGHLDAGSRLVERAMTGALARNDSDAVRIGVEELGSAFHANTVRPAMAYRIAQVLDQGGNAALAERTYAAAGAAGGALGAKALLRAAELRLASHTDVQGAATYLDQLQALGDAPADLLAKAAPLRAALQVHAAPGRGREVAFDEAPSSAAPGRPTVRRARLLTLEPDAVEIEDELQRRMRILLREVLAVAVAVIPSPEHAGRNVVLTDLVLKWGSGEGDRPLVVRLAGGALSLGKLYPKLSSKDAYASFLARVLEASAAAVLPDKDELLKGNYPCYPDVIAFEVACYASAA